MKRSFAILTFLFLSLTALAQEDNSIILDPSSFHSVQSDALTGVNIDPIAKDSSRNPCARIKIKFANMIHAEIDALEIKFRSNTDLAKRKVADYFDNVLILEMTAKENTRFYVKSPEYGESNEITLNLEGNREYEMTARLNQTFSIVVNSNVEGAEVYIDDIPRGRTNSDFQLVIPDIVIGNHTLKVVYGSQTKQKPIEVNKNSITFRQEVDSAAASPQHVTFQVMPMDAMVEVDDGTFLQARKEEDGIVDKLFKQGSYSYTVTAPSYHPYSGTFVVRDDKVVIPVTLTLAFGYLSITGTEFAGATVYVDNMSIGKTPLLDYKLPSGEHRIKVVKPRYKPFESTVTIKDTQTTNLMPTLEANFASVEIVAVASDVDIYLNDKFVSQGVYRTELEVGTYKLECRKMGHKPTEQYFDVTSSKAMTFTAKAPKPMYGAVDISSSPNMADITIDGKATGQQTPVLIRNLLVGEHTITVSKQGRKPNSMRVTVTEGKTKYITIPLSVNTAVPTPAHAPQPAKQPKNGYEQSVEATYSIHTLSGGMINHIGLSYIGGYRTGKFFIGAGVGAEYNLDKIDNNSSIDNAYQNFTNGGSGGNAMSSGTISIPVFLHLRAYMGQRSRTFLSLSAGGKLLGTDTFEYRSKEYKYNTNGLFADLNFGLKFGKFHCAVGATTQTHPCAEFVTANEIALKSKFGIGAKLSVGLTF